MDIVQRIREAYVAARSAGTISLGNARPGTWLWEFLTGGDSSGIVVNEHTAIQLSAVWTCVNIRAGLLASLPLKVYQREKRGRRMAREHRLYPLLHDQTSPEDTSYNFRHKMMANFLLAGNGYAEIARDGANRVAALYPWVKSCVRIELGDRRGQFWYVVHDASGERRVDPANMLHLRGFTSDGLAGLSVIQNHRRSLGIAVRTEVFATNFYDNGARASGVLMYPGKLGDKGQQNLLSSFDEKQSGVKNAGKTILLEEGAKYLQLTIPPNDAQFLETRQLGRAEIAGIFRIPTMLVPGADKTPPTYASSEQFMRYVVDFTLRDDLTLFEQELNAKLFSGSDYYAEFDLRDLMRGDSQARAVLHKAMWEIGAKSANDINDDENENPVTGGDRYYVPLNFVPVDKVDEQLAAKVKPDATQVPPTSPVDPAKKPAGSKADAGELDAPSTVDHRPSPVLSRASLRLFRVAIGEIQQWERPSAERAAVKLLAVLRIMAEDLVVELRDEPALASYAAELAQRVKAVVPDNTESEIERAVAAIRACGGTQ